MVTRTALALIVGLVCCQSAEAAEQITFTKQAAQPGQKMVQHALVHTDCVLTYEQSNQVISETDRAVRSTQVRQITTLAVQPPVVQVTYSEANLRVGKNRLLAKRTEQPVAKKTYRVRRIDGDLQITNLSGDQPPEEELQIVKSTMSWVGQPNELAEFLHGRTVSVDERLVLPSTVANKIFGGAVGLDSVHEASLTLTQIKRINGARCGEFAVSLVGNPNGNRAKRLKVGGKISVEANTCRTAAVGVESDLDVTEERGPKGATFTVKNRGTVRIAIKADFDQSL